MQGLQLLHRDNSGADLEISEKRPQYLFLEPKQKIVIRYRLKKTSLDVNNTKLLNEVTETDILSVKVRIPNDGVFSKISDFSSIDERSSDTISFEVDFTNSDTVLMDVLFESKIDDRLKIKIRTIDEAEEESFENENTVTDGPDEFVKLVDVKITPENVYYVLIYRRSGRLKKSPNTVSYERLANILSERMLNINHPDNSLSYLKINEGLVKENWLVDTLSKRIYKEDGDRKIDITPEELGNYIKTYGTKLEILNLLKTTNYSETQHELIKDGEQTIVSCDTVCSLQPSVPQNTSDSR